MRHVVFVTGLLINLSSRRASNFIHARNAALALANDFMREKNIQKIVVDHHMNIAEIEIKTISFKKRKEKSQAED